MSFTFKWPRFSDQFHADAIQMLDSALNKGNKPPVIADKIEVVELEMGTQPPELEIRDIGEMTMDQFRGIFRLTYEGDAHIVLRTKVQVRCKQQISVDRFPSCVVGKPIEPQATRHTHDGWVSRHAGGKAPARGPDAPPAFSLQAQLLRCPRSIEDERDHPGVQDRPSAECGHQQHFRLHRCHSKVYTTGDRRSATTNVQGGSARNNSPLKSTMGQDQG